MHVLVVAKSPVPGRVKTRLCPPLTHQEAARLAEASLAQTLQAVAECSAERKLLALDGRPGGWIPPGFSVFPQRDGGLDERLAGAWQDAGGPGLQIGMDTPQVTGELLDSCLAALDQPGVTSALGPATDGGWWAVGLAQRWALDIFTGVPMSTPSTGRHQLARMRSAGHTVASLMCLRDVDTFEDARAVAAATTGSRFSLAWSRLGRAS
jgi:uncharacterized protein